ncbi:Hint domain-containing protein [Yoonia sp. R2331]|uniref:Hint domain-containing protein n=1 Tax=Yoonia sp. R2331 TaxID=3237238 RepID=UPI0034E3CCF1
MATGYLVNLGADGVLGIDDTISGSQSTFTEDGAAIATGSWVWTGVWTGNGQTYSNIPDTGLFYLGTDGNTYFIPDTWTISSGSAVVTSALDGTVDGTSGDDVINANYTGDPGGDQTSGADDTINAGSGDDTVQAGLGDDIIDGGTGNDSITGETGDDSILGGAGNDILRGDESAGTGRAVFQWSAAPDPSGDGSAIDDGDFMTAGFGQDTGGTTITYAYNASPTGFPDGSGGSDTTPEYSTLTNVVSGINTGGAPVDTNSSLWIGGDLASSAADLTFADPVTNVSFRVNDIDSNGIFTDRVTIRAYDANGLPVTVTLTPGANLILDATNNNVTSNGTAHSANDPEASVLVNIPGPVSRIEIIYTDTDQTGDDGLVNVTDIYFDEVADPTGDDTISGGLGDDTIFGDGGNDLLTGDDNNDEIYGGEGADSAFGGTGDDTVSGGEGADYIDGDAGNDTLYGGGGADTIVLDAGNDVAFGGSGGDDISATGGDNTVFGDGGADTITMGAGNDVIDGGDQSDEIYGGAGDDILDGGEEASVGDDDTLYGGAGNDTLTETETDANSNDELHGDAGNDTLSSNTGVDTLYGGADRDTLILSDTSGADQIEGGEAGDDYDVLDGSGLTQDTTITWTGAEQGTASRNSETAQFSEIEEARTGSGNDTIDASGSPSGVVVDSGAGDDSITGSAADDTIDAGDGADTVDGGAGDDTIDLGGTGPDGDADLLVFSDGDGNDTVTNFDAPTPNGDGTFTGIDLLDVSSLTDAGGDPVNTHDVTVTDDGSGNAVLTFPGGESITLVGISPADADNPYYLTAIGIPLPDGTVEGTAGADTIDASYTGDPDGDRIDADDVIIPGHGANDDLVYGYGGADSITSGDGNDTIYGGTGNDTIDGGADADTIFGGADADTIIGGGGDVVDGGEAGNDNDTLTVSAVDRIEYDAGNFENGTVYFADGTTLDFTNIENVVVTDRDGTVSGTAGGDLIDAGYTGDPDGDVVDGDDAILPGDTDNDDLIEAGAGNDTIIAGDGNDDIFAGTGDDTVFGGAGNDSINGEGGNDTLSGGAGSDTILGGGTLMGGGDDDFLFTDPGAGPSSVYGGVGNDFIIDQGDDASHDLLDGGTGNDDILGGRGNDTIVGGDGDDTVGGGDGDDVFFVGDGVGIDLITGGEDTETTGDTIEMGQHEFVAEDGSTVYGGVTEDMIVDFTGDEAGTISADSNTDDGDDTNDKTVTFSQIEQINLGSGNDTVNGDSNANSVDMGDGDDTWVQQDGFGDDTIVGGEGGETTGDRIDGSALTTAVTVDFSGDEAGTLSDGTDTATFSEIEQIETGAGDDTVLGDTGNDNVSTGAGNDTLSGGAGDDSFDAGAGNDTLDGGTGNDTLIGGDGDDTFSLTGTFGDDTITGGEAGEVAGGDVIDASSQTDDLTVNFSGAEAGTISGGGSNANFAEIEQIITGSGDDQINGGAGNDNVSTGAGNDTLIGGAGEDTLIAGSGNDTLTVAEGDTASGDEGDDTFVVTDLAETTTGAINIDGGAGSESTGDTLDINGLATETVAQIRANAVDDGTGSYSGSYTMTDGTVVTFSEIENIICFTPGTNIATPHGARDIADLRVGDMVVTRDHGLQPIRWIQRRTVPALDRFAPVRIRPGVVTGLERDLVVSPQHRMLFQGYRAELLFGETEVLVAAKHLVDGVHVTQDESETVTYIHMMFDEHEVVYAEGAATESFHPGSIGLSAIHDAAREELFHLFPDLRADVSIYGDTARKCLKRHEADLLRV